MEAALPDKVEVEGKVVLRRDHRSHHLAGDEQVAQVGLGVGPVHEGSAVRVQRGEIVLPFGVAHVHHTVPGEEHAVAPVAGRHHSKKN